MLALLLGLTEQHEQASLGLGTLAAQDLAVFHDGIST
jgi:hypothetical protein